MSANKSDCEDQFFDCCDALPVSSNCIVPEQSFEAIESNILNDEDVCKPVVIDNFDKPPVEHDLTYFVDEDFLKNAESSWFEDMFVRYYVLNATICMEQINRQKNCKRISLIHFSSYYMGV